jgi:hypothetical protein
MQGKARLATHMEDFTRVSLFCLAMPWLSSAEWSLRKPGPLATRLGREWQSDISAAKPERSFRSGVEVRPIHLRKPLLVLPTCDTVEVLFT